MLHSAELDKKIENKYLYLDTNFLSYLFYNGSAFKDFITLTENRCHILIVNTTKFEFLRDIHIPKIRIEMEKFILNEMFYPAIEHSDLHIEQEKIAMVLSKIYSINMRGKGVSYVDLLLGAHLAYYYKQQNRILITQNINDFPSYVFDPIGTISFESTGKSETSTFWFLTFNIKNFEHSCIRLANADKQYKEELSAMDVNNIEF